MNFLGTICTAGLQTGICLLFSIARRDDTHLLTDPLHRNGRRDVPPVSRPAASQGNQEPTGMSAVHGESPVNAEIET